MNKTNYLVSIVIPTFNHSQYLKKALKSIINQTYENWEVIVVDNYSVDDTEKIVANFKNNKIKYLKNHNNGIIAASRNIGIKASKGEWIAFLDSDDWWTKDKLKTCIDKINDEVDLIYHDLEIVSNNPILLGRKKIKSRKLKKPIIIDLLINGNAINNSSVIVRKKLLERINGIDEKKDLVAAEDFNTWLRIASLTDQYIYLPKTLGYYLIHDQSISKKDMSLPTRNATKEFLGYLTEAQRLKQEALFRYISGRFCYLNNNFKKSKKDLLFALRNGNIQLKIKSLLMIIIIKLKNINE